MSEMAIRPASGMSVMPTLEGNGVGFAAMISLSLFVVSMAIPSTCVLFSACTNTRTACSHERAYKVLCSVKRSLHYLTRPENCDTRS